MNDSIYEEYMRSVLGYQPINTYAMDYSEWDMANIRRQELENCYPDIYRIIYPMIQRVCIQNTRPITRELIDSMTDEIYFAIEDKEEKSTQTTEDRQIRRNTNLNDLIRILILRELLGRPGFPGGIPPRSPVRPPKRPPRLQPRPGMGIGLFDRNTFGQYDDLYEY